MSPQLKDEDVDHEEILEELYRRAERQKRNLRLMLSVAVLSVMAAALYWILTSETRLAGISSIAFGVVGLSFVVGIALLSYLQGGIRTGRNREEIEDNRERIYEYLDSVFQRLRNLENNTVEGSGGPPSSRSTLTSEERKELITLLRERIQDTASAQVLCQIRNQVERERSRKHVQQRGQETTNRLRQEVTDLSRRGNLNLVLGILTTLSGIALLGWTVFNQDVATTTPAAAAVHYFPRITLVLLIEVFAYFFLSLYRRSLNEIKYFQNELTNVEHKILAANTADQLNDPESMRMVLTQFASTDRNLTANTTAHSSNAKQQSLVIDALQAMGRTNKYQ